MHRTEMNQLHPPFSIGGCHKDPYVFISAFETWLLQFSTVRFSIQLFQKVQNTAARITLRATRAEHTSPLLRSLHWLPVKKRIKHKVCSICYTTLAGASPKYMWELVNVYTPSRCLRSSSDSRTLTVPCVRTKTCGQRSFAYHGPATWNELPFDLRHKDSLSTFKSALKTHLFHHLT